MDVDAVCATLDAIRKAQCDGKARYVYLEEAERALALLVSRYPDSTMHAYYCVFCNNYHVGRIPTVKTQASIRRNLTLEKLLLYDYIGRNEGDKSP